MAKWGEGDPRWIVEDRPDAKNVNNWHWTMKDASGWSKGILKDTLKGLKFEDSSIGKWSIKEVTSVEGEASASNRKGNLIILYDWTISTKISGSSSDEEEDEGTLNISNFSDESETNDVEIAISLDKQPSSLSKSLAQYSRTSVVDSLLKYVTLLRDHYSQGLILPCHNKPDPSRKSPDPSQTKVDSQQSKGTPNNVQPVKIATKRVKLKETFKCSCEDLYNVFVTEELVAAFTRSQVLVNGHKGGRFMLMNGEISGEFVELDRPTKLVQKWRSKNWPDGHFSNVTFLFNQNDDGTDLTLTQTGIPDSDHERTKDGWKRFIFEPIKQTFGYGAILY